MLSIRAYSHAFGLIRTPEPPEGGTVYTEERRQEIALVVRQDGRGDVSDLANRFEVTPETIRRDLTGLERHGVLRRVHGGAIPIERFRAEPAIAEKAGAMAKEKARIASAKSEEHTSE